MRQRIAIVSIAIAMTFNCAVKAQEHHSPLTATVVVTKGEKTNSGSDYPSLFEGGYEKTNFEFTVGYVNKSWRCTYPSGSQRENFFGEPGKYLHGIQVGGIYTPSFDWGLGLRTGIAIEFYYSHSPLITSYCSGFNEVDMYIPLHATYRIPFVEDIGMTFFGGMAFQWAMSGQYYKYSGFGISSRRGFFREYRTAKQVYGVDGWPKRVNWQAECGISLRVKRVMLSFIYSFGVNEHGIMNTFDDGWSYETAIKSRQDKMQASIAFAF